MAGRKGKLLVAAVLAAQPLLALAQAQAAGGSTGIYTCIDRHGRRLTSDRPIVECLDREQRVLDHTGTPRQTLGPTLTPLELQLEEDKRRRIAEQRQREVEERRRDRVLLARYPSRAEHDAERAKALEAVALVIAAAEQRIADLNAEHGQLQRELRRETDRARVAQLQRLLQENDQHLAAQQRLLANHEEEKQRIRMRFDEELARLQVLWADRDAARGERGR